MSDSKGFLVVPVGFRSDGSIHALELDDNDYLKVAIASVTGTLSVEQSDASKLMTGIHGYDGTNWQKLLVDEDSKLIVSDLPHSIFDLSTISQIMGYITSVNGSVTLYTTPVGKTAYISTVSLSVVNSAAAGTYGFLGIYNASAVLQGYWIVTAAANNVFTVAPTINPPLQLPASWSLRGVSPLATLSFYASFIGYEL